MDAKGLDQPERERVIDNYVRSTTKITRQLVVLNRVGAKIIDKFVLLHKSLVTSVPAHVALVL